MSESNSYPLRENLKKWLATRSNISPAIVEKFADSVLSADVSSVSFKRELGCGDKVVLEFFVAGGGSDSIIANTMFQTSQSHNFTRTREHDSTEAHSAPELCDFNVSGPRSPPREEQQGKNQNSVSKPMSDAPTVSMTLSSSRRVEMEDLLAVEFTVAQFLKEGYSVRELCSINHFSLSELIEGGCSEAALLEEQYALHDILEKGGNALDSSLWAKALELRLSPAELKTAGCSALILKELGTELSVLRELGYSSKECHTVAELKGKLTVSQLLKMGYGPLDLIEGGCKLADLVGTGCSTADLIRSGYRVHDLLGAGISYETMRKEGWVPSNADYLVTNAGISGVNGFYVYSNTQSREMTYLNHEHIDLDGKVLQPTDYCDGVYRIQLRVARHDNTTTDLVSCGRLPSEIWIYGIKGPLPQLSGESVQMTDGCSNAREPMPTVMKLNGTT